MAGADFGDSGNTATLDVIAGLNPENEQLPESKLKVAKSPTLDRLLRQFDEAIKELHKSNDILSDFELSAFMDEYCGHERAAAITWASIALRNISGHGYWPLGDYLTTLVNSSPDTVHTIYTSHHQHPLSNLGYRLSRNKTMHVRGPAGIGFGGYNQGTIIVHGPADTWAGNNNRGLIIVYGNVGSQLGSENTGNIIVKGDADDRTGYFNRGTIDIDGKIVGLSPYRGAGNIYHNGRLIVKDGKLI